MWRRSVDPAKQREAWAQVPADSPIVDGRLLGPVTMLTGANLVEHGLGRTPVGAIQVACSAGYHAVLILGNDIFPADAASAYFSADTGDTFWMWVF
jgi:hypothetical protein